MLPRWPVKSLLLLIAFIIAGCSGELNPSNIATHIVGLPGTTGSITFNDMVYDPRLAKVLIPANETGNLFLVDPDTYKAAAISGFTPQKNANGQLEGLTSVATGRDLLFAANQGARSLSVIDPLTGAILSSAPLMSAPGYVRYVPATNELWVTEEAVGQIEVLTVPGGETPKPVNSGVIPVPDGPESLVIDKLHGVAYTNRPAKGLTVVINVLTRNVVKEWGNGCSEARGLALDEDNGYLFVACKEGKLVMLDTKNDGAQITSLSFGGDLNTIGYNPTQKHVYLPSSASALLLILKVADAGGETRTGITLDRLGTADTALGANCVVADDRNNVWVCDPTHGRVLLIKDTFAESTAQGSSNLASSTLP